MFNILSFFSNIKLYILIIGFLVASCSARSFVMDDSYEGKHLELADSCKCQFIVTSVEDDRKDKESLGKVGLTDVSSADVVKWLENGLLSSGFKLQQEDHKDNRPLLPMSVKLKLAYIKSYYTSKASNIVIEASIENCEKNIYLRGSSTGINWAGTSAEIKASFDKSLAQALDKLAIEADKECESCLIAKKVSR